MKSDESVSLEFVERFLLKHRLPRDYETTARRYFEPLARKLPTLKGKNRPLLLGINGAQGTGKSTLADFLAIAVAELFAWRTAVLSIDDFYLTRDERALLADAVHPLLETRGVPGTHDTVLLAATLDELIGLAPGKRANLPRFEKSIDDRAPQGSWPTVEGPLDLIILEGWCVGTSAETEAALVEPINDLERLEDSDGRWRRYVNEQLRLRYEPIFKRIDALAFLAAPSFVAVLRWRIEQEQKLAENAAHGTRIMSDDRVARFICFYERLTRHNLHDIPQRADVFFALGEDHAVVESSQRFG